MSDRERELEASPKHVYKPFLSPIIPELAYDHKNATRLGKPLDMGSKEKMCQCCGYNPRKEHFGFTTKLNELKWAGICYPYMFYTESVFVMNLVILLFIHGSVLFWRLPSIIDCFTHTCDQSTFITAFKNNHHIFGVSFIVNIIVIIITRYLLVAKVGGNQARLHSLIDKPEQFTVLLKGISPKTNDQTISRILNKKTGKEVGIVKINRIYDIREPYAVLKQYIKYGVRFGKAESKYEKYSTKYDRANEDLLLQRIKLKDLHKDLKQRKYIESKQTNTVLVTFKTREERELVLSKVKGFMGFGIRAKETRDPYDIIWHEVGYSKFFYLIRLILTYLVAVILISLTFLVMELAKHSFFGNYLFVMCLILYGTNYTAGKIMRTMVNYQHTVSYLNKTSKLIRQMSLFLTINPIISIILIHRADKSLTNFSIYGDSSIVMMAFIYLITEIVLNNIMLLFSLKYLKKKVKRLSVNRSISKNKNPGLVQFESHKLFEGLRFEVDRFFIQFIAHTAFTFFFSSFSYLFPLLGGIGCGMYYFSYKWVFVYRSVILRDYDFELFYRVIKYTDIVYLKLSLGHIFVTLVYTQEISIYGVIALIVLALQTLFGSISIVWNLKRKTKKTGTEDEFDKAELNFANDFDRLNPMTQHKAYQLWLQRLEIIKKGVSVREFDNQSKYTEENKIVNLYDYTAFYIKHDAIAKQVTENPLVSVKSLNFDIMRIFNFYKLEKRAKTEQMIHQAVLYPQITQEDAFKKEGPYEPIEGPKILDFPNDFEGVKYNKSVYEDMRAISKFFIGSDESIAKIELKETKEAYGRMKQSNQRVFESGSVQTLKNELQKKFKNKAYFLNFNPERLENDDMTLGNVTDELDINEMIDSYYKDKKKRDGNAKFEFPDRKLNRRMSITRVTPIDDKKIELIEVEDEESGIGTPQRKRSIAPERFKSDFSVVK